MKLKRYSINRNVSLKLLVTIIYLSLGYVITYEIFIKNSSIGIGFGFGYFMCYCIVYLGSLTVDYLKTLKMGEAK